ncbi:polysaccharide biosynthesis protein [Microaceticoccus formicicus]|uniref:polysaccharide biosynthesis protein n=1 Tax=Microaceticoccus formicicus TaxID=3118105 RepID=UPI003CD036DB|nr:nucleoside-diphosphate sugar epimerase/dehydratase [Peptoniphilaceae bacterium AMB_02]
MRDKKLWLLLLLDAFIINANYIIALLLRFEMQLPQFYVEVYTKEVLIITAIKIIAFILFKLYSAIWRYASVNELLNILGAVLLSNLLSTLYLLGTASTLPRSIYPIVLILDTILIGGIRLVPKIIRAKEVGSKLDANLKRTLIVGAGESGLMVLRELKKHPELGNVTIAFVDDDPAKYKRTIDGVQVAGNRNDIPELTKKLKIDEIIVAMPSAKNEDQKKILDICSRTSTKVRIVPGVYEMIDDKIELKDIRDIEIDDLLGRDEIKLNTSELSEFINGKVVLVTGGGGSIGSELCRQVVKYNPKQLLILDIYENTTYDIQNEIRREYPELDMRVFIESVRDRQRLDAIFSEYRPQIIFHAAAHKHVPLMEGSPESAVKNNVFGTLNVVLEADHYDVEKFVLISTDKAVNPTNIMGATKRICEMIIQSFNRISKTDYVAVRFGNVLGSHGSVIPLFLNQINKGGPVTVTDERIIRYFMSIPEATQLVLQAGAIAKGGEIFVLDMGEPVKIIDLAEKLIRLHGHEPYKEIDIEIIGLRPGEKLFEELLLNMDLVDKTEYERIFVEKPTIIDFHELEAKLVPLMDSTKTNDRDKIVEELRKIVPTFDNYVP